MDRATLLAANPRRRIEPVEIEGVGIVHVREMSLAEAEAASAAEQPGLAELSLCLVDANGEALLTEPGDAAALLQRWPPSAVGRLQAAIREVHRTNDLAAFAKNS